MPESESKSESKKALEPKREPREPRALSTEYHKARKQLMLWAGILFIWELVGIDLEKAKEAGGNAGALIRSIKSPQAIPWALLILVGYFFFKVMVEWYQCNSARRKMRVARLDLVSSASVALLAYALYIGQTLSRVQLADLLGSNAARFFGWIYGLIALVFASVGIRMFIKAGKKEQDRRIDRSFGAFFTLLGFVGFGLAELFRLNRMFFLLGAMTALLAVFLVPFLFKLWRSRGRVPNLKARTQQ